MKKKVPSWVLFAIAGVAFYLHDGTFEPNIAYILLWPVINFWLIIFWIFLILGIAALINEVVEGLRRK